MNSKALTKRFKMFERHKTMQEFGERFVEALPQHLERLKIPGRALSENSRREPLFAQIEGIAEIQTVMREVLYHPTTQKAQFYAESTFEAFLKKTKVDVSVLKFFNGWNETHKTTSLVSAKIIMRLSADALSVSTESQMAYHRVMAHMHEVAKDDFGLGHEGHDGKYEHMTAAFSASAWVGRQYCVDECDAFSGFLYGAGIAGHKLPMGSVEYKKSIMDAMLIAIASELWNGREYNFMAQYIEAKLLSINPLLSGSAQAVRHAGGYVLGHAGEVENRHGLHALAATQAYGQITGLGFSVGALKEMMLDYNARVGRAFKSLHEALI